MTKAQYINLKNLSSVRAQYNYFLNIRYKQRLQYVV